RLLILYLIKIPNPQKIMGISVFRLLFLINIGLLFSILAFFSYSKLEAIIILLIALFIVCGLCM
ncbi:MAG TPA: hypothetical protein DDX68_20740, partial [Clostridium sp.]|nr:hypothetical protein [Clostridium sp.]